jgi:peptidoglycan-associated lipoprotein
MMSRMHRLAPIVLLACGLAGCSTSPEKGAAAPIDDRAISSAEMDALDGARTAGVDGRAGFRGGELDDPQSPLATRVFYFELDSSEVRSEYRPSIEAHAAYLASNGGARVVIEGHADERGSREYNIALGERRALALRRQLVLLGASADQIRTVSYGEERPVETGSDEYSWERNRRAEIVYEAPR